jgi:sialic acid synthase SpsE
MNKLKIGDHWIGEKEPVYIIAEAGINHNGKLKNALKIIDKAKESGANAIKFQTFLAEDLASEKSKFFKLFKKLELSNNEFRKLKEYANKKKIEFLSTPFSFDAVDLLVDLNVPAIKIASGDLTNIPLIQYASSKKKPMILSTGMAKISEIKDAVKSIKSQKNHKIAILHSTSSYPNPLNEVNLNAIKSLQKSFRNVIGYSDNGNDLLVPVIAVSLGAKIIEKHFTLDKNLSGPDHAISANPKEFTDMIRNIRKVEEILDDGIKKCQPSELQNLVQARRSITAKREILQGEKIKKESIDFKRPATGIAPRFIKKVIGKTAKKNIHKDESIKWNELS